MSDHHILFLASKPKLGDPPPQGSITPDKRYEQQQTAWDNFLGNVLKDVPDLPKARDRLDKRQIGVGAWEFGLDNDLPLFAALVAFCQKENIPHRWLVTEQKPKWTKRE
jgi:hypothetical protein